MTRFTEEWQNNTLIKTTDLVATMTPDEVFALRQNESRELAGNKIEAVVGDAVVQRNSMAYSQLLQRKESKGIIALSPQEQAALDGFEAQLLWVMLVRQASNNIEADIQFLTDPVAMMDYDIVTNPLWPLEFSEWLASQA